MAKHSSIPFFKMSGAGNDFVILDNRKSTLPKDYSQLAKKLCERKFSIGADGLLVLEKCTQADFRMIYYNADGSRAEMCGNGARCIARFAHFLKIVPAKMDFLTDDGIMRAEVKNESVKILMGTPKDLKLDFVLKIEEEKEFSVSYVNTGVPHCVLLVTDLEKTDVDNLGKTIRFHKEFAPEGTNANFVLHKDEHNLVIRTYERGVEAETLACGTGVVASSLICAAKEMVKSPVSCLTKGGDTLKVFFDLKKDLKRLSFENVCLEGPTIICFKGEVEL